MMKTLWIGLVSLGMASAAYAETGIAVIKGTGENSNVGGTVTFQDSKEGLKVDANLTGLPPGNHGFHIHEFGSCEDSGKAAGGHYNPKGSKHGFLPTDGLHKAHGGDMGNITAGADGTAALELVLPKITLTRKHSVAGRAVIVHEKADDFSQPVGNAGSRIGCGPILVTGK
jgi:Cu-Zn family superoxide dismutase